MADPKITYIEGSKSGGGKLGGGGGGNATTASNTLRNNTFANFVDLISEGPIGGLVGTGSKTDPNGQLKSIFLNGTVLQDTDGHANFNGTSFEQRFGYPDQDALLGNPTVQTPHDVSARVMANQGPIVRTITEPDATSVLVVVQVPALFYTDTSSGSVYPFNVYWQVKYRKHGGPWVLVEDVHLQQQKCTSPYERQTKVVLPADGYPWDIQVVRTYPDNYVETNANDTYFASYTVQVEGKFTYPNSALIAGRIDASQFGSGSIPSRNYLVDGRQIQIPSNYNPTTRAYTGIWDGTFKDAVPTSSNPAWILYDMLVNNRYGLGQFIDTTKIDKWGLYQIGQYCDQQVPDGFGGFEPRYTLNTQITNRQDAFKLLQQIGTAFRGMSYWSLGQVFSFADMPEDPVKLVAPANVIDGQFEYQATGINARHSVAVISWNDPGDFYQSAKEVYVDDDQVNAYGWREIEVQAFGCTSRSAALRYGKWVIDTEKTATETVEYQASWDHADVRPGNVIAIADPSKAQVRTGGRIKAVTGNTVTIDAPFTLASGQTYQFWCELPDGTITKLSITSIVGTLVNLSGNFATLPNLGAMWTIVGSDVNPRQYRVLSIVETSSNVFKVTALFHDPTKYERVEDDIILEPVQYSRPKSSIAAPTNLSFAENLYFQSGVARNQLFVSWTPGNDFLSYEYQITATGPQGPIDFGRSLNPNFELDDPVAGDYTFSIAGVSKAGLFSPILTGSYTVASWGGVPSAYVSLLEIFGQGNNTNFTGQNCKVTWRNNFPGSTYDVGQEDTAGQGMPNPLYRDNVVRVYDPDSNILLRTEIVNSSTYTYTYEHNSEDNQNFFGRDAHRKFRIEVTVRDNVGRESAPAVIVCQNPVPDLVIPNCSGGLDSILVQLLASNDPDFRGFFVWVSDDQNFDPLATTPAYKGQNTLVTVPVALDDDGFGVFYVRAAAYDAFSTSGLNISPPVTVNVGGNIFDTTPPAIPNQPTIGSQQVTLADGTIQSNLTIAWDAVTSKNLAYYEVQISENGGGFVSFPTANNSYSFTDLKPGSTYLVQIRAVSQNLYRSGYSLQASYKIPPKTTPTGLITNLSAISSLKNVFLSWTNPIDVDYDHTEVWVSPNNSIGSATLVGSTGGAGYTHSGLNTGQTYYYFLRPFNTSGISAAFTSPVSAIPGQVQTIDLGDKAIVTSKIALLAVTSETIAGQAITNDKIVSRGITADKIASNTITANEIAANSITADRILANSITAVQIAAGTITSDRIQAGTITGDRFSTSTNLPATITVGATGVSIGTIQDQANRPAAYINAGTTQIDPGRILISGSTTLASWRDGGDNTKINGGNISANSIQANRLTIGSRGLGFEGLQFSFDKSNNIISWSAGFISYINDAGTTSRVSIQSNYVGYSGSTVYIVWPVGQTYFLASTDQSIISNASAVLVATYVGNIGINAIYGATQVDGTQISTNSITANQITTNEFITNSAQIRGGIITNTHLAGTITFDKLAGGTLSTSQAIYVGSDRFTLDAVNRNMHVFDENNTLRAQFGRLPGGGSTDYGLALWDVNGNLILSSQSGQIKSSDPNAISPTNPITAANISQVVASNADFAVYISSLAASKISATSLSSITASLGTVTAGRMQSNDGRVIFDLDNSVLTISDAS